MKKTPNHVVAVNTLCSALLNSISMLMMPIYSNLLGTDSYGLASIYTTWATILSVIIGFQLSSSIGVAQKDFPKEEQLYYQANGIYFGALMALAGMLLAVLFRNQLAVTLGIPVWSVLFLVPHGFGLFCINFLNSKFAYEFKQEKNLIISVSMSVGAAVISVLLILALPKEGRYFGKVVGAAIPQILCGIFLLVALLRMVGPTIKKKYMTYTVTYGLPLVFSTLCLQLFASSDKLMLQKMDSNSAVGIYSLAYNFAGVISSIWYALNSAWSPFYYQYEAGGDDSSLLAHMKNFVRLFSIITVGFLLLAPEVFTIFAAPDFWSGIALIPLFVVGHYTTFVGCFARNHQYYYKKTKTIAAISIGSSLVNVGMNAILIPIWGGFGAAFATMITQILSLFLHWLTARYFSDKKRIFPYSCKMFFPYGIMIVLAILLFYYSAPWWVRWPLGVILGAYMISHLWKNKQIF